MGSSPIDEHLTPALLPTGTGKEVRTHPRPNVLPEHPGGGVVHRGGCSGSCCLALPPGLFARDTQPCRGRGLRRGGGGQRPRRGFHHRARSSFRGACGLPVTRAGGEQRRGTQAATWDPSNGMGPEQRHGTQATAWDPSNGMGTKQQQAYSSQWTADLERLLQSCNEARRRSGRVYLLVFIDACAHSTQPKCGQCTLRLASIQTITCDAAEVGRRADGHDCPVP
jgi:hypothetical protein